jgi:hypothetical protein
MDPKRTLRSVRREFGGAKRIRMLVDENPLLGDSHSQLTTLQIGQGPVCPAIRIRAA